jgi:hypothetical protein
MKTFRAIALVVTALAACIFLYANTRRVSPSRTLKPVALSTYQLVGTLNSESAKLLENQVEQLNGVTACSVRMEGMVASVVYYPDIISEASLKNSFTRHSLTASMKEFNTSGKTCPVHQIGSSFDSFLSALDLRTH